MMLSSALSKKITPYACNLLFDDYEESNFYAQKLFLTSTSCTYYNSSYARIERGGQGVQTPPEKSQKYRVSSQYWSGSPEKSQSYQANIHCWAIIAPQAKRHFNGVLLAGH